MSCLCAHTFWILSPAFTFPRGSFLDRVVGSGGNGSGAYRFDGTFEDYKRTALRSLG